MSTLRYLDMLYERGGMEKSQFFKKNLARVMNKLPKVSNHCELQRRQWYVCVCVCVCVGGGGTGEGGGVTYVCAL